MLPVPCVWLTKLKKKYIKNYFLGGFFNPQKKQIYSFFQDLISAHINLNHNNKAKLNKMVDTLNITAKQPKKKPVFSAAN